MVNQKTKQDYQTLIKNLKEGEYLSTNLNNELLYQFIQAKLNGGYGRIQYDKVVGEQTALKKSRNLSRIDHYFKKDFDKLTEKDILKLRQDLNDDNIKAFQTIIEWKIDENGKQYSQIKLKKTDRPLSYRTKKDYVINFKEFYDFLIEYYRKEKNIELKEITKFFDVRKSSDYNEIKVDYIPDNELEILLSNIHNRDFKAMVQLNIMSGARPCEILNIKYGKGGNLYKNTKGEWIIHLPKIKRVSYKKWPFKIDMYEEELIPYLNNLNLKEGQLVWKTTSDTFRKLMKHYTTKYIGKHYSPKILRKTARMIRTNAKYSESWINKLMGHSPNSKIQAHYVTYDGVDNDQEANDRLKEKQNPNFKTRIQKLEMELKASRKREEETDKKLEKLTNLLQDLFDDPSKAEYIKAL